MQGGGSHERVTDNGKPRVQTLGRQTQGAGIVTDNEAVEPIDRPGLPKADVRLTR